MNVYNRLYTVLPLYHTYDKSLVIGMISHYVPFLCTLLRPHHSISLILNHLLHYVIFDNYDDVLRCFESILVLTIFCSNTYIVIMKYINHNYFLNNSVVMKYSKHHI